LEVEMRVYWRQDEGYRKGNVELVKVVGVGLYELQVDKGLAEYDELVKLETKNQRT
jgi:hypothetical protein